MEEIEQSILQFKVDKTSGLDNIPAELLKSNSNTVAHLPYSILQNIWATEQIPAEWKMRLIMKIPKKGDPSLCK